MREFKATADQAAAIQSRGSAVLVSAGAGSGKTKVLTERLMGYLCDPEESVDLDSFLIITFTRAAAGELRGRIMEELSAALAADPGNRRLRRQSALCRRAQIGTIHSFCAALLRENSHLAGLSPDFKILDEERAAAMQQRALERTLEAAYDKIDSLPGFALLADTVGAGRDDRRLAELVLSLHGKMQCHARPEQWAQRQVELLRAGARDAGETVWGRELLGRAAETAEYWAREMDRQLADMAGDEKMARAYGESFAETADALRELRRCLALGWDKARACFPLPFPKLGSLRNPEDPELAQRVKERRKACKAAMDKLAASFHADSEKLLWELSQTEPAMSALLALVLAFDREYDKDKSRGGFVDYADLEHKSARLLLDEKDEPTELARQVSRRYTEIMVDEYQDVSQVQDAIFRAVSREGKNLFLVGDVKQAIYRFRLADPEIFTRKYLSYQDAAEAGPGQARRILLRENFRSRREILAAANAVFSQCMSRSLGDLDYDEAAALRYGAGEAYSGSVPVPELLLLALPPREDEEESPDKAILEADMVARQIRQLVDSGATVTQGGAERPMQYGDVAILLRSGNNIGGVYRRALAAHGVPVAAGQGGGFFVSVEISGMMSMLAVLDDPHQDIPLIAVLRSPAFGFSADELSRIRAADKTGDFFTALEKQAETDAKCADFLALLEGLRRAAPDWSAAELVWRLLEKLDMLAICSAMSDGEQRRARLLELVALAERFESSGYRGLHRFVLWLRRLAEKNREPSLGAQTGSAVQIMTVHKSKGLEFPVVFLCDTARRFNKSDNRDTVLVHQELGLGPRLTDLKRRVEYPTLARNAIELRLERELLSEEMRLLYVAMTRARERLYITAALKDPEKTLESARLSVSSPMAPEVLARAQAPVQWLISACLADREEHLRIRIRQPETAPETEEEHTDRAEADAQAAGELERRLSFRYPWREAEELPSKITATELKGRREADAEARSVAPQRQRTFRMPDFTRADRPVSGAEKGVATHLVLQYMDFDKAGSREEVQQEIQRLRQARFLSDREAQAVDAAAIVTLFASPLGRQMRRAEGVHREFRFSLLCDAEDLLGRAPGEEILLQGVVDCFLEEDEGLTVIDYKTDQLRSAAEARQRAESYRPQLGAYAKALERICGKPVRRCVLYFLSVGTAVTL